MFFQEGPDILPALPEANITVGEKGTGFGQEPQLSTKVNQTALPADAVIEHNVELGGTEGRSYFVLDYSGLDMRADDLITQLDGLRTAQLYPYRGLELECPAAGRHLRVTEDNAHFFPELVNEDHGGTRFADGSGQFAERLRHQAGLQRHVGIPDLPL